jgi:hypothetical protein
MDHGAWTGWARLAAAALLAWPAGCGGSLEAHPPRSVYVEVPPPEPLPEMQSGPPAPGMAWIAGYWHFSGAEWVWIPGHWEVAREGWRWRAPSFAWSQTNRSWVYELGRWEPAEPAQPSARGLR